MAQSFALLPGISRSGISMVAGLLCDLDHEHAARFSFLLATPVILAAAIARNTEAASCRRLISFLLEAICGGIAAGDCRLPLGRLFDALL